MKRKNICSLALTLLMLLSCLCAAYADTGSVTYDGRRSELRVPSRSDDSPTDCFRTLRSRPRADRLTQTLRLRKRQRPSGAAVPALSGSESGSEEFLSQMTLTVQLPPPPFSMPLPMRRLS